MAFFQTEQYDFNFAAVPSATPTHIDSGLAASRLREFAENPTVSNMARMIFPEFYVLSADKVTRNRTLYTYQAHKGRNAGQESTGQHSFVQPYKIPIIDMHRSHDGCGIAASKVFGRMRDAKLVKNKETGKAYLAGLGEISEPEAIDEILTGRWLTGSLGSSVPAAHCSICNQSLVSQNAVDEHPHQRGMFYRRAKPKGEVEQTDSLGFVQCLASERDANLCYTAVDEYRAQEYSKVVIPSDNESTVLTADTGAGKGETFHSPSRSESEEPIPASSLWVPMSPSSSRSVSDWGERYVDLITSREVSAESLGLMHGLRLHEYADSLSDGTLRESFSDDAPPSPATPVAESHLYCGPDRSFPAGTLAEFRASLRYLEHYHGADAQRVRVSLLRAARKSGWSAK